jgi:hypothetical protein
MTVLARIPVLGLLAAHPGSHADKLRARPVADDARTDGPPPDPATGAARYPRNGALLGGQPRRPGSAGLPAIDPGVLAHLHRRLGLPRETETREAAS